MDLKELKRQIFNDCNIIPLLESLDCINIHEEQGGQLICAGLPEGFNSKNKRTIQIKNTETLTSYIRSKDISGDIFAIVGYILYECNSFEEVKENLHQIVQYICNTLNYEPDNFKSVPKDKKSDWLYFLRPIQKERNKELTLEEIPQNKSLVGNLMEQYINYLHEDWHNQGITEETRKIFDVRYDLQSNRIIFPIHNTKGNIIGVKGRYVFENKDEEENSDIPKYLFLYPFYKSIEFFNFHRAYKEIKRKKQIIILESEKACMLSTQWGILNCIGLMGGDLSPIQVYKLKKLGIEIEFVFMWDADKNIEFIKKQLRQLKNRKIKVMIDKDRLLKNKDSPVDRGEEIYKKLLKNYIYDFWKIP